LVRLNLVQNIANIFQKWKKYINYSYTLKVKASRDAIAIHPVAIKPGLKSKIIIPFTVIWILTVMIE